jgi:cell division protein FtsB
MREFQEQKKQQASINRIFNSKWFFLILLIILFFLIKGNIRIIKNYFYVKDKNDKEVKVYEDLKAREIQLNKDIERLKTEQGLDYEIRKKLDVSLENEKIIKIIDKK